MTVIAPLMLAALDAGGTIYLCGNGGSASDCNHIAAEFVGRCSRDRKPLPAVSLCANPAVLTAIANDYGYEMVFARQVRAFCKPGDLLIGLSTSGRSLNVKRALDCGNVKGATTLAIVGGRGILETDPIPPVIQVAKKWRLVRDTDTWRVQEHTMRLLHDAVIEVEEQICKTT